MASTAGSSAAEAGHNVVGELIKAVATLSDSYQPNRMSGGFDPLGQQRRLAVPGTCDDHDQRARRSRLEAGQQPLAPEQPWLRNRDFVSCDVETDAHLWGSFRR